MAKAAKPEKAEKLNEKEQYERFRQTVHQLGIDEKKSRESFERAFSKIVPPKFKGSR
jgi:hypothetical protein